MSSLLNVRSWNAARQGRLRGLKWARAINSIEQAARTTPAFEIVEERFRQIAARCLDVSGPTRSQSLAVSSAVAGEGKSSVAMGIAVAAAQNLGTDVLILETDMQRPQLASDLDLAGFAGLSEYLSSNTELESIIHQTRVPNVWLLPAGRATENPGPLIRSRKFGELMKTLHGVYQTIIIDTPPLLTSPHAAVIANQAQGVVLVARAGRTHIDDAASAVRAARGVPVRGFVLNGTKVWLPRWLSRLFGVSPTAVD